MKRIVFKLLTLLLVTGLIAIPMVTSRAESDQQFIEKHWTSDKVGDWISGGWGSALSDYDSDGDQEFLVSAGNNNVSVYGVPGFEMEKNITAYDSGYITYNFDMVEVEDVDSDQPPEIICGWTSLLNSGFTVVDGDSQEIENQYEGLFDTMTIADIDGDDEQEIITAGNEVTVLSGDGLTEEMNTTNVAGSLEDVVVRDLNGDGSSELVGVSKNTDGDGRLYIYKDDLSVKLNKSIADNCKTLSVGEVHGEKRLLIGSGDMGEDMGVYSGYLRLYSSSGEKLWESEDFGKMVHDVKLTDLDDSGAPEFVVAKDKVEVWNGTSKEKIWTSDDLITVQDKGDMVIQDFNDDGNKDIIVRSSAYTEGQKIHAYKVKGYGDSVGDDSGGDDSGMPGFTVLSLTAGTLLAALVYHRASSRDNKIQR